MLSIEYKIKNIQINITIESKLTKKNYYIYLTWIIICQR